MLSSSPIFKSSSSPFTGIIHSTQKTLSPAPGNIKLRPLRCSAAACASTAAEKTISSSYLNPNGMTSSFYDVLGISMGSSNQEIKSAYRRLARECHPDVAAVDRKDTSADAFMKIHAAYSTLSDPSKRTVYDRELFHRHRTFASYDTASSTGFRVGGYTRRNWETDQCW